MVLWLKGNLALSRADPRSAGFPKACHPTASSTHTGENHGQEPALDAVRRRGQAAGVTVVNSIARSVPAMASRTFSGFREKRPRIREMTIWG
jgi:hypothetical protein